eukprot:2531841-Prymnesium_polylepis.1
MHCGGYGTPLRLRRQHVHGRIARRAFTQRSHGFGMERVRSKPAISIGCQPLVSDLRILFCQRFSRQPVPRQQRFAQLIAPVGDNLTHAERPCAARGLHRRRRLVGTQTHEQDRLRSAAAQQFSSRSTSSGAGSRGAEDPLPAWWLWDASKGLGA